VEGQSAFVGWPFSLDLGLNINKQQAKNINKQQATSEKTPGPVPDRERTRSKGPGATSTCIYKIYSI
tara:strand:- start:689 stop:889 length:201 start_codon:yes stop_codon:yes gene_type:complete